MDFDNDTACIEASSKLYLFLEEKLKSYKQIKLLDRHVKSKCFHISIPPKKINNNEFNKLSILIPFEAYGNRDGKIKVFEIALFNDNNIVHIDSIGYQDVCRFNSMDDILFEVIKLTNM
jgi:hypothetical protein